MASWISYPGDAELSLLNKTMRKRYERDVLIMPFWRMDNAYENVKFLKWVDMPEDDEVFIKANGIVNVSIDDRYVYGLKDKFILPKGKHSLLISVYNETELPCIYLKGKFVESDDSFRISCHDNNWIVPALFGEDADKSPNDFKLETKEIGFVGVFEKEGKRVYDFGREMMSYVKLNGVTELGELNIYYGESPEEAVAYETCELCDKLTVDKLGDFVTPIAKAFRYLCIETSVKFDHLSALFEYLPVENKSAFSSSDELLNKIYDTSIYTLSLCTREFFIEGIKRDRWVWSGDAYQIYLMNYYSFFVSDVVKRTTIALLGKEPYKTHINHIMDYSFFWLMGVYDYYEYTGDTEFIKEIYEKAKNFMDFCIGRTNANGLMEGIEGDWVFIDWAEGGLDNSGEVSFEQMLFAVSLDRMYKLSLLVGKEEKRYKEKSEFVKGALEKFWDKEKGAYIHSFKNGKSDEVVYKYANMMAILYDLCDDERKDIIKKNVLLNEGVKKITTPYMRFYELAALCEIGEYDFVLSEMKDYWGGMLKEGATTFWETYNPEKKGKEKYAMYGRDFGLSLCHAWGASPLYLIGRYFMGLKPVKCENADFEISPYKNLSENYSCTLPLEKGTVKVEKAGDKMIIYSTDLNGIYKCRKTGKQFEIKKGQAVEISI